MTSPLPEMLSPALLSRTFSPAELGAVTGITPLQQRQWKMRRVVAFDASFDAVRGDSEGYRVSEYSLTDAFRWFMLQDIRERGFEILEASYFAARKEPIGLYEARLSSRPTLYALCRPRKDDPASFSEWLTFGQGITLDADSAFTGDFGFYVNLTDMQTRFLRAVEAL